MSPKELEEEDEKIKIFLAVVVVIEMCAAYLLV